MSRRSENEAKQATYDEFRRYVEETCRDEDDNPQLSIERFSNIGKSGVTHMPIRLENVVRGTIKLFKKIEAFKKGTELTTQEVIENSSTRYIAQVPFRDEPQLSPPSLPQYQGGGGYYPYGIEDDGPSPLIPQILFPVMLSLIIVYMYNYTI